MLGVCPGDIAEKGQISAARAAQRRRTRRLLETRRFRFDQIIAARCRSSGAASGCDLQGRTIVSTGFWYLESRSKIPLQTAGAWRYAGDESTEILCGAPAATAKVVNFRVPC